MSSAYIFAFAVGTRGRIIVGLTFYALRLLKILIPSLAWLGIVLRKDVHRIHRLVY
jgi:hypothetical protein